MGKKSVMQFKSSPGFTACIFLAMDVVTLAFAITGPLSSQNHHLLVDSAVVHESRQTVVTLGPISKSPANPLLAEDREWEGSWKNANPSVVYKDGIYHLWITTNIVCPGAPNGKCAHPGYNWTVPRYNRLTVMAGCFMLVPPMVCTLRSRTLDWWRPLVVIKTIWYTTLGRVLRKPESSSTHSTESFACLAKTGGLG